jgi:signal transduction histidine kinase
MDYETAYVYDPKGDLQVSDMASQTMATYKNDLRLGFRSGAVWIRFTPQTSPSATGSNTLASVLRVWPFVLDRIELHEWVEGQWTQQVAGDMQPFAKQSKCPDDRFCLALKAPASASHPFYIRVQNHSLLNVQTQILAAEELPTAVAQRSTVFTTSLILACSLLFFGVTLLLLNGSPVLLIYCVFQSSVVLFFTASTGLLFRWSPLLPPMAQNMLMDLLSLTRVLMTIVLGWAIMASYRPGSIYRASTQALLGLCAFNMVMVVAGVPHPALELNLVALSLHPLLQIWAVTRCPQMGATRQRILLLSYTLYILVCTFTLWTAFAPMDSSLPFPWFAQFSELRLNGSAMWVIFFVMVVYEQRLRQSEQRDELKQMSMKAHQAHVFEERLAHQRALVDLLTHEMTTPLGTIKFALASLARDLKQQDAAALRVRHIDQSIDRLDTLIKHALRENKIDAKEVGKPSVKVLAQEFLKGIAAEYAHPQRFVFDIQPQAWFHGDPTLLLVTLGNLMNNAYKYGLADQPIKVTVHMTAQGLEFEISNPVAAHHMPDPTRLFDRYYRHENVQSQAGTGLGLSLVQRTAQLLNATVDFKTAAEHVVFKVRFKP